MRKRSIQGSIAGLTVFLFGLNCPSSAQDGFPARSIQLVVPAPAGGGADVSFRTLAQALEPLLRQKIEVVNKPGNGGTDGLAFVAKAAPDGYTLGAAWNGPLTASPQVRDVGYTLDSFTPVASTSEAFYTLCAHADFPASSGKTLIDVLREKPLSYTYGNEGKGGSGFFAAERFFETMGVFMRSESFNGSPEIAKTFAENKLDFYIGTVTAIAAQAKAGKAKCLIVLSNSKPPALPDASTLDELDTPADEAFLWRLIVAPRGLNQERLAKLENAITMATKAATVQQLLVAQGDREHAAGSVETAARLKAEFEAFATLADRLGIKRD